MNIYTSIRELAKTNKWQNLFSASKDISSIHLFRNVIDFSKLQELFLEYLYIYDIVQKDILIDGISQIVLTDDIYVDSYLLWRKDNKYKEKPERTPKPSEWKKDNRKKTLHLFPGKKIKFLNKEAKKNG